MIDKQVALSLIKNYYSESEEGKHERLGQFLINSLAFRGFSGIQDPDLFYTKDDSFVRNEFMTKYVFAGMDEVIEWDKAKTAEGVPNVDLNIIRSRIREVAYHVHRRTTICIITASNGSDLVGESHTVENERFNMEVGKRFAFQRAFDKLVECESYCLRNELAVKGK